MSLEEAVRQFIEYEERGSKENWCEWDQHFQQLKECFIKYENQKAMKLLKSIQDYQEEK